jgi:hypothetical protein
MHGLLVGDLDVTKPAFVALAFGAATLVLVVKGQWSRQRPVRVAAPRRSRSQTAALATLDAVYRRGDITREDYLELSRRLDSR